MRFSTLFIFLSLVLPLSQAGAAEPRPGMWDLTVITSADGAERPFGPYSTSQCLTEEDVRNPEKLLAENGVDACTYSDKVYQGDSLSFTVQCGGAIPMGGSGKVNYTAESLQGNINIAADLNGLLINTQSEVSGRRTGDCTK
jgi:hypothetical protein